MRLYAIELVAGHEAGRPIFSLRSGPEACSLVNQILAEERDRDSSSANIAAPSLPIFIFLFSRLRKRESVVIEPL
jgi:hypothetical protein